MKIVHIISDSNVGGAGILLENLLRHTALPRGDIRVVLPHGAAMAERYARLGVRVAPILTVPDRSFAMRDFWILLRYLRAERPDTVHTHGSFIGRVAAFFCGVPVRLYTRHCAYPVGQAGHPLARLGRRVADTLLSTRIIATADAARENLLALGTPAHRITVIRNGAESVPPLTEREKAALREKLGIPPTAFCVGICARLAPVKDHATLLRAGRILLSRGYGIHMLIVGGGEEEGHLRHMAREWGLFPHVTFTGHVENPGVYMNLFSLSVNCSVGTETSCLATSEAMSLSIPSVVSRFGGNPETVRDGENGLLFPPRDAGALADATEELIRDPALYARLSAGAYARFCTDCNARAMVQAYDNLYLSLKKTKKADRRSLLFSKE